MPLCPRMRTLLPARSTADPARTGPPSAMATAIVISVPVRARLTLRSPSFAPAPTFPEWLLERRKRAEPALITVVADCYLAGVCTRRTDKLVKTLGINNLSKSQVSRMAADLDTHVEQFRHRPLDEAGPLTFVTADALTMKVREGGRVVNAVVPLATGVNDDGHREVLGMRVATSETGAAWNSFFADLVARGLGESAWSPPTPMPGWSRRSQPTYPAQPGSAAAPTTRRT